MDIYEKWRPGATQSQIVRVGRWATSMVIIAMAWIPVIKGPRPLQLPAVGRATSRRRFVVFFFGVFIKRLNAIGCLSALVVGFVMGSSG